MMACILSSFVLKLFQLCVKVGVSINCSFVIYLLTRDLCLITDAVHVTV